MASAYLPCLYKAFPLLNQSSASLRLTSFLQPAKNSNTCKKDLDKKGFTRYEINTYTDEEVKTMMVSAGFEQITIKQFSDLYRDFTLITGKKMKG